MVPELDGVSNVYPVIIFFLSKPGSFVKFKFLSAFSLFFPFFPQVTYFWPLQASAVSKVLLTLLTLPVSPSPQPDLVAWSPLSGLREVRVGRTPRSARTTQRFSTKGKQLFSFFLIFLHFFTSAIIIVVALVANISLYMTHLFTGPFNGHNYKIRL